jgi:hypothetical protein
MGASHLTLKLSAGSGGAWFLTYSTHIGVTFSGEIVSPGLAEGRERLQHWSIISVQHLHKVLGGAIAEVETRGAIAIEDVVACGRLAGAHEAREAYLQ